MIVEKTEITRKLFQLVKRQYRDKIISRKEYVETLEILLNKLNETELSLDGSRFLSEKVKIVHNDINVKLLLNSVFAMS